MGDLYAYREAHMHMFMPWMYTCMVCRVWLYAAKEACFEQTIINAQKYLLISYQNILLGIVNPNLTKVS